MSSSADVSTSSFPLRATILIVALYAIIAAVRISSQSDLYQGDQPKQADYVLDIICRGNWLVQHHADGTVLSKPPLYNWLAAPGVMLFGTTEWALKLPSLLAGFATILMLFDVAWRRLGRNAALYGCVFLLLTSMFVKQIYYARTDMLMTCFVVMQFWAVLRWEDNSPNDDQPSWRNGWLWILWIAAGLGNLSKGPIALLIPHMAFASWWACEGRLKSSYKRLGVSWGLPFSLLLLAAWFVPACLRERAVYDQQFQREIVDRFEASSSKSHENRNVFYYLPQLFARTVPWSLLTLPMFFLVPWRQKSDESREGSGLRLMALWIITTVVMFSVIPSKRIDRIFPAIPPFCLLAGFGMQTILNAPRASAAHSFLKIMGWITAAAIFVFGVLVLLAVTGHGPLADEHTLQKANVSVDWLTTLRSQRALVSLMGASITFFAATGLFGIWKRHALSSLSGLALSVLVMTVMYQNYFGEWLKGGVGRDAEALCSFVSQKAQSGAKVYIMAGCAHPMRYNLKYCDKELHPADSATVLSGLPGGFYVIGTMSREGVDERKPGSLEAGGAWGAKAVRPGGELVFSAGNSPLSLQRVCVIYFK